MNAAHTPGPWLISTGDEWTDSIVTKSKFGDWTVASVNMRRDEAKANKRLIAAAPDLLDALEKAYSKLADITHQWEGRHTQDGQGLLVDMRDAIASAKDVDAEWLQNLASMPKAVQS